MGKRDDSKGGSDRKMKIRYDETGGFEVWAERDLIYTSRGVIPLFLKGEIGFSIVEGPETKMLVEAFLQAYEIDVEDRVRTWRTIPTNIEYSISKDKKAVMHFRLTIVG